MKSPLTPPVEHTSSGQLRRVGVEIEFGGLSVEEAAKRTAIALGGRARPLTEYEWMVTSPHGETRVEYDAAPLKALGRENAAGESNLAGELAAEVLEVGAGTLFPTEIVLPPLPPTRLGMIDELTRALEHAGAEGTETAPWAAYGVHFNPELPSPEASSIRDHLRAFALLYPWIVSDGEVDLSRRGSGYIRPYPSAYLDRISARDYDPTLAQLIDDYLEDNPTRNRALDMLPAFAELDEPRVRAAVDDERVNARPTFHYRLANSSIGKRGWRLTDEWHRWLAVERLADQPELLERVMARYREARADRWSGIINKWPELIREIVDSESHLTRGEHGPPPARDVSA